jgi:hypothetical protein
MHRSHSKLQRYAQYVGSVPLMPQSEKHSGFRPVHVAAALTAREARFLAALAGNTNHAASIPVMARVAIRMISSDFSAIPPKSPGGLCIRRVILGPTDALRQLIYAAVVFRFRSTPSWVASLHA